MCIRDRYVTCRSYIIIIIKYLVLCLYLDLGQLIDQSNALEKFMNLFRGYPKNSTSQKVAHAR